MLPKAQCVGQQGSEAVGTGSNPNLYLHFLTQLLWRKIVIPPPLCMKSFVTRIFLKPGRVLLRNFWHRDKKFSTENRDTPSPPPQDPWTFSLLEISWNTAWKLSSAKCFGTASETKNFRQKIVLLPSLIYKFFRYRNFSETQKCSPTNFFGTVRQQLFDGQSWYSLPPPLLLKIFTYQNFSDTSRDSPTIFLVLWNKNFHRKIVILPLLHKI